MGQEILCTVRVGRKSADGKALLETNEIIFRSPDLRLKIPLSQIEKLEVADGKLSVGYTGGYVVFELGAKASVWADKIRNPKSLIDKLGIKPEHRVAVLEVRDDGFLAQLHERAPDVSMRLRASADVVFLGAETLEHLAARLPKAREAIKRDGMIWTVTPKGKGGVREADVMAAGKAAGLVDVKVTAFSATHSALKWVIPKALR